MQSLEKEDDLTAVAVAAAVAVEAAVEVEVEDVIKLFKDNDLIRTEEGLVFNPYNPLNAEVSPTDIQHLLESYGLPPVIHNMELYRRAFVHISYIKRPAFENVQQNIKLAPKPSNCLPLRTKSNERLEFLGDGLLELVTKYVLYRRFPKAEPGFMTDKKIDIVKNEAIGKIALEMGLHRWLILSRNAEEQKTRTNLKKLGCLFEAFVGALFLDFNKIHVRDELGWFEHVFVTGPGFQMVQRFVENVFDAHIDWVSLVQNNDNYKNILQVKIQKEFKVTPHYMQVGYSPDEGFRMGVFLCLGQPIHQMRAHQAVTFEALGGSDFEKIQTYAAEHLGRVFLFMGEGQHKIKRKAEQIAAQMALKRLALSAATTDKENV